jgi:hypothetical protein
MMDGQAKIKEQPDALRAAYVSMTPFGRLGRPEEVASSAPVPGLGTRAALAPVSISSPTAASPSCSASPSAGATRAIPARTRALF